MFMSPSRLQFPHLCMLQYLHLSCWLGFVLQLGWTSKMSRRKINFQKNQKGYDYSETTIGKLSARKIQIFQVYLCVIHFHFFFKITFQIMLKQKYTRQIWIHLVKYSSADVADPSEVPRFVIKTFF